MNCPKSLRNGPCGGVRQDGGCEVYPDMPCVWLKAFEGAQNIPGGVDRMKTVQPPVDHRKKGASSWLAVARGELSR
jgi:Methylene-tetrahydrofolate reductase C terminal